jgi:glycerol-3-phosphate acyltransferase PlsX
VSAPVTVALDAMGSDQGADAMVAGARDAVSHGDLRVLVCGPAPELEPLVRDDPNIEVVHAPYVISHEEEPARAARERDDASVVTCMRLVREGRAQAAVSAGATGAVLAAGLLELRRLPGVLRPAIVQPLPSAKGPIVVLDIGATPDPRPNQLHQFAHMGTAFSASVLGVHEPRVGLLSNGHEEGKGNRLVIDSYRLLADDERLRFAGNIEGRDVPLGAVDVVVTDGFTGNVVLKLLEGTGAWLFDEIRQAATSSWQGKIGGLLLRPKLRPLRDKVNPDTYGGSYLIGLRAIAVKAHGDSGSVAISNALRHAARGVREGLIEDIARRVHPEPRAADPIAAPHTDTAETA